MNEKLKELIVRLEPDAFVTYKGYLYHANDTRVLEHSDPEPLYTRQELEKFAELIVEECIERVRLQYIPVRDQLGRTEREQGIVECGVASVIALEELIQDATDRWYKENILGDEE
jgi:hypothetical protein